MILLLCACQAGGVQNIFPSHQTKPADPPIKETNPEFSSAVSVLESAEYLIVERFQIANHGPGNPSKHNLWAALIQDFPPYQQVVEMSITGVGIPNI